jgi:hypothetical protein
MLGKFSVCFIGFYVVNMFIACNFRDLLGLTYVFLGHSWQESWYMPLLLNGSNVAVLYFKWCLIEVMVLKVVFNFVFFSI